MARYPERNHHKPSAERLKREAARLRLRAAPATARVSPPPARSMLDSAIERAQKALKWSEYRLPVKWSEYRLPDLELLLRRAESTTPRPAETVLGTWKAVIDSINIRGVTMSFDDWARWDYGTDAAGQVRMVLTTPDWGTGAPVPVTHSFHVPTFTTEEAAVRYIHREWRVLALHEADEQFRMRGGPRPWIPSRCPCGRALCGDRPAMYLDHHRPFDPHVNRAVGFAPWAPPPVELDFRRSGELGPVPVRGVNRG